MLDIKETRQEIDKVDAELMSLLEKRMTLVTDVVSYKQKTGKAVLDQARESDVIAKVSRCITNKDFEEVIIQTFSDIMKHSRAYQSSHLQD